jgi:hypothetical protein
VTLLAPLLMLAATQTSASNAVVWHWDRDDAGCALMQNIDDQTILEIARTPGNEETSLAIRPPKPTISPERTFHGASMSFRPTGDASADVTVYETAGGRHYIYGRSTAQGFMGKFSGATEIDFNHEKTGPMRITIGAAEAAAAALRTCEDAKMRDWGIDPTAWRALPVKPLPKTEPRSWLTWLDYPDREKIYKNDINVVARLDLAADGSVQACTVVNQPPAEFIAASCKALKRSAKLQPARDASGNGIAAPYVVELRFGAFLL